MKKFSKGSMLTMIFALVFGLAPIATLAAGPAVIDLGSLETNNFVVFGQTGVTDASPVNTTITGNVGTSLVASPAITGLSCTEMTGSGNIYILTTAGYAGGHDSNVSCLLSDNSIVNAAVGDFTTAYNDAAAGKIPTVVPPSGTLSTQTFVPGTYKWAGNVTITGDITLAGSPDDIWIFQIAGNLDIQNSFKILLSGGAQAKNVFWAVAGNTTLFPGSIFEGNILGWSYIAMQLGATLHGRALSQTQVTLIGNTISAPTTAVVPAVRRQVVTPVVPIIGVMKVPSPLALPGGPGEVTYKYTVWNVSGLQELMDVTVVDDKCLPVVYVSGDTNFNTRLDTDEKWNYSCTVNLANTTTNTAIATAHSSDGYYNTAVATAIATVAVGTPVQPPLIHIIKVPSQLTPLPFGGGDVTYTYTVTNPGVEPINNVTVTDDKCSPVSRISGDTNSNNLLNSGEKWIYTCKSNIKVSTGNVAKVTGDANGFTAIAYAFTNVLVSPPSLPNTGLSPDGVTLSWPVIGLSVLVLLLLFALVEVVKKKKNTI